MPVTRIATVQIISHDDAGEKSDSPAVEFVFSISEKPAPGERSVVAQVAGALHAIVATTYKKREVRQDVRTVGGVQ